MKKSLLMGSLVVGTSMMFTGCATLFGGGWYSINTRSII